MKRFGLIVVAVGVIVLAYHYLRGLMMLGYVDSAIVRVRAISEAETQFARAHPQSGYTCTLSELPRNEGIARVEAQAHIDNGYAFEIVGCEKTEVGKPNSTYYITARPLQSGQPAFCSDSSGVLKSDESGSVERCIAKGVPLGSWRKKYAVKSSGLHQVQVPPGNWIAPSGSNASSRRSSESFEVHVHAFLCRLPGGVLSKMG